jgi:hypothetical protein
MTLNRISYKEAVMKGKQEIQPKTAPSSVVPGTNGHQPNIRPTTVSVTNETNSSIELQSKLDKIYESIISTNDKVDKQMQKNKVDIISSVTEVLKKHSETINEQIEKQFEEINERIDKVESDVSKQNEKITALGNPVVLSKDLDELEKKVR